MKIIYEKSGAVFYFISVLAAESLAVNIYNFFKDSDWFLSQLLPTVIFFGSFFYIIFLGINVSDYVKSLDEIPKKDPWINFQELNPNDSLYKINLKLDILKAWGLDDYENMSKFLIELEKGSSE